MCPVRLNSSRKIHEHKGKMPPTTCPGARYVKKRNVKINVANMKNQILNRGGLYFIDVPCILKQISYRGTRAGRGEVCSPDLSSIKFDCSWNAKEDIQIKYVQYVWGVTGFTLFALRPYKHFKHNHIYIWCKHI